MPYKDPEKHRAWAREYNKRPEIKAAAKVWREAHPEKLKEYQKAHYKAHKAERNAQGVEAAKAPHRKVLARWGILRKRGWSQELYESTLYYQNNACAICKAPFEKSPHADHAHTNPPVPRGLLCSNCNTGLGLFSDSPERLKEAARYLRLFM